MTGSDPATRVARDPLLSHPPAWTVLRIGLPLAVGMASHVLFNLVDLLLIGRLGQDAVAAAHVATTINFLPMILGNGISVATISILSRRLGAGDVQQARDLSSRSQVLMVLLGLVVGTIGAALAVPCIDAIGAQGEVRREGIHYLVVSNLGVVTMYMLMQSTGSMRALGEVWMPLILLIGANVLNLILDVILLFGWDDLGIAPVGVVGAAYASVIARALTAAAGLWWLRRPGCPLRFRWRGFIDRRGDWHRLFWLAVPQVAQMTLRGVTVIGLTRIAGDLAGNDAVAAIGVTTRLDTMILFAAVGFASAATTVTGRCVATDLHKKARATALWSGVQALVFGAVLVTVFAVFAHEIVRLFIPDASQDVLDQGALYLSVAALGHPLGAYCIAISGAINGAGRMVAPMVLDAIGYGGLLLPALMLGTYVAGAELVTVWWVFAAGNLVLVAMYTGYALRAPWTRDPRKLSS